MTEIHESQKTVLVNGQEKSLVDIKNDKNPDVVPRKKHSDEGFPSWVVPVLVISVAVGACLFILRRYLKGRGTGSSQRPYSRSDQRDATVVTTVPDGLGESHGMSSARQNRGRNQSERSSEHQLELQPAPESAEDDEEEEEEEYDEQSEGSSPGEDPQAQV